MKLPLDVHTHRKPDTPSQAIINIRYPETFHPEPGQYYSIGLHTWDVHLYNETQFDWEPFTQIAAHPQVIAIGECGIDKCVNKNLLLKQEDIFSCQIRIAKELKKPLIIHNVRATGLIHLAKKHCNFTEPWIQHGFRGNWSQAKQSLDYNIYPSFGPIYNEETVRLIPLTALLLETDDSDVDIHEVYHRIAATRKMTVEELTVQVQENIKRLFFNDQEL